MGFLKKIGKAIGSVARTVDPTGIVGGVIDIATGGGQQQPLPGLPNRGRQSQIPGLPPGFRIQPAGDGQPPVTRVNLNGNGNGNGMNGFSSDIGSLLGGDRIVMETIPNVINSAPPGWVVVDMPDGSGKKAVRKEVARCLGLHKSRPKPPISASDWKKLKTANRVRNKAKKIAQTANFKCVKK